MRVRSGAHVFVYEITGTRRVSFRSAASLARQRAAVPGRPGATAVRPMITLSTCATAEATRPATTGRTASATPSTGSTRWASWSTSARRDA